MRDFKGKIADELHKIIDGDFDTAWFNVDMQKDTGSVDVYFKTGDEQYFIFDGRSTSLERMKAWIRKYLGELQIKDLE